MTLQLIENAFNSADDAYLSSLFPTPPASPRPIVDELLPASRLEEGLIIENNIIYSYYIFIVFDLTVNEFEIGNDEDRARKLKILLLETLGGIFRIQFTLLYK